MVVCGLGGHRREVSGTDVCRVKIHVSDYIVPLPSRICLHTRRKLEYHIKVNEMKPRLSNQSRLDTLFPAAVMRKDMESGKEAKEERSFSWGT